MPWQRHGYAGDGTLMRVAIEKIKWQSQDIVPELPAGEVHILCVRLDNSKEIIYRFLPVLSNSEIARAERFYFEEDRGRYVQFHGILRMLIARYICSMPHEIVYGNGTWGKPYLTGPLNSRWLKFSASRSRELALYSFARGAEIGIDVEFCDEIAGKKCILESLPLETILNNAELRLLEQLRYDFFGAWTGFEAFRKAMGLGIGAVAREDSLTHCGVERGGFRSFENHYSDAEWTIFEFSPSLGYAASFAVENLPRRILMQNIEAKNMFRGSFEKSIDAASL